MHAVDTVQVVMSGTKDGVVDGALTFAGFLHLQRVFIERGRLETTYVHTLFTHG